jgi:FixJ family two-component response regulator
LGGDPKLWLDVLEQGGYDVLVQPYQREEIKRIVEAAAARSYFRSPTRSDNESASLASSLGQS